MELIFATGNQNKVKAVLAMVPASLDLTIKSMGEIGITDDIPETQNTFSGNALQKSMYLYEKLNVDVFSEDSGLEIEALNNEPGVYSARYAGEDKNHEANMDLVLKKMQGIENRKARFRATISLILNGKEKRFEGFVNGKIAHERKGTGGFGYDPIFIPDGFLYSFGQLPSEVKYGMSHRSRALEKMIDYLVTLQT